MNTKENNYKGILIFMCLFFIVIVVSCTNGGGDGIDLSAGLIAYFPFNGNAADESANSNDGTVNGASLTTDRYDVADRAYNFNGSSDYIDCGDDNSLHIAGAIRMTVWVAIDDTSNDHQILGKGQSLGGPGNFGYALGFYSINKKIYFDTYDGSSTRDGLASDVTINDNSWYFIAATWDGTTSPNTKKIYIDGALAGQQTSTISELGIASTNFEIGVGPNDGLSYFDGKIDDIRVYNRALSEDEIQIIYTK